MRYITCFKYISNTSAYFINLIINFSFWNVFVSEDFLPASKKTKHCPLLAKKFRFIFENISGKIQHLGKSYNWKSTQSLESQVELIVDGTLSYKGQAQLNPPILKNLQNHQKNFELKTSFKNIYFTKFTPSLYINQSTRQMVRILNPQSPAYPAKPHSQPSSPSQTH